MEIYYMFYKGSKWKMQNDKENEKLKNNKENERKNDSVFFKKIIEHPIVAAVVSGILLAIIGTVWNFTVSYSLMQKNIEQIASDLEEIKDSTETMDKQVDKISEFEETFKEIDERLVRLENSGYDNTSERGITFLKAISPDFLPIKCNNDEYTLPNPTWSFEETIAIDENSGEEYSAGELVNRKVLLSYTEDGIDTIFCGQFNVNNNWDGECLINSYTNGILTLVMEANYDNGNLVNYKQIIPYSTSQGEDAWLISDRTVDGTYNSGNSWSYYRNGDKTIKFELNDISEDDLITFENFSEADSGKLEGFYHGKTSDGYYNDDSGQAYLVKYGKDGTVRTLYVGVMKDGKCEDSTGNAWSISRDEELEEYVYYKGEFKNNSKVHKDAKNNRSVSVEEIKEIIKDYDFECDLRWAGEGK